MTTFKLDLLKYVKENGCDFTQEKDKVLIIEALKQMKARADNLIVKIEKGQCSDDLDEEMAIIALHGLNEPIL